MSKTVVFYHFDDTILRNIIDDKVIVVAVKTKTSPKKANIFVCQSTDMPPESEREEQVVYFTIDAFLEQYLTDDQRERYCFQKFCLEQHLEDVKPEDLIKEARNVSNCKELYAKYVCARTASVHIVDSDVTQDLKKTKKSVESTYTKALCYVFDTEDWIDGDVVVVRKALKPGCNCAKFVYNGKRLEHLDYTIDEEEGHMGVNFPVVSKFPICYWANPFDDNGVTYRTVEHNSLVVCDVTTATMHEITSKRADIIEKVKNEKEKMALDDRLIVFTEGCIKYGIICEFGMDATNYKQHQKDCDSIFNKCGTKFYMQYPRFKSVLQVTQPHCLVTKDAFVANLEVSGNQEYSDMIKKLTDSGVAPTNIGFIDCGSL